MADPAAPAAPRPRFGSGAGLAAALLGLVILVLAVLAGPGGPTAPEATGPAAVSSPQASPAPQTEEPVVPAPPVPTGPAAAPPQRLVYPAADIDVAVYPLGPSAEDRERQTIVPPPTMDGYWLTPYGMPGAGSTNTTYIAGHSWQDREAPFNRLSTRSAPGDTLTITTGSGELAYRVESVTTYVKSGLKDSPIWEVAPNRLVLISCYTDDLWGTNVVVVAAPV